MGILRNDARLRKAYMSYQNDGVLDVFIGWCIFLAGLLMFTEIFWMAGAYVALIAPMFLSFKESVTVPRLGSDELDEAAGRKIANLSAAFIAGMITFALLGLVVLVLLVGARSSSGAGALLLPAAGGIVAVVVLGGFALLGYLFRAPRWYAYGALAVVLSALAWATGVELPWIIMAVGALIALTGSVYLFRFLRSHPSLPISQRPNGSKLPAIE